MKPFLDDLLHHGTIRFTSAPKPAKLTGEVESLLKRAFAVDALDLAGPELACDTSLAFTAAEYVRQAAWYLVSREEQAAAVQKQLKALPAATSASQLASVDLLFRYLPNLYQRAKAFSPGDVLTHHLKATLLQWPLAGALADVAEAPTGSLDFFGHRGLQMRYAERLVKRPRAGWGPSDPASLDVLTLVFQQHGRDPAVLRTIELNAESNDER